MIRKSVKSSNVVSVGYDEDNKVLEVEFIRSGVYRYSNVPKRVYENFLKADSVGKFLHTKIKGVYRYTKV